MLDRELKGVALRDGVWEKVEADREHAVFSKKLPKFGLEIYKTYRLEKVPEESCGRSQLQGLSLDGGRSRSSIKATKTRKVAYRLDGPNGLPTEGYWYASKVSRNWSGAGLRDVVVSFDQRHADDGSVARRSPSDKLDAIPGKASRSLTSASMPNIFPPC